MNEVTMTLKDTRTEKLIKRTIDISNVAVWNGEHNVIADVETQSAMLNEWIRDRGNEQHDTTLALVSWFIA